MSEPEGRPAAPTAPPPGSPAPPPEASAQEPAADPTPSTPAPTGPGAPDASGAASGTGASPETGPLLSRPRTLVKAAGLTLLILGGFFAVTTGLPAATLLQPGYWDALPGGNLTVAVPGHSAAPVRLLYPGGLNATATVTDPSGNATLHASRARFTLEVEAGGRTLRGDGILPAPASLAVTVDPQAASAAIPHIGYPEWLGWAYAGAAVWGVLLALGGLAAFRLKGYRLAATASGLHVGLTLFLLVGVVVAAGPAAALQPFILALTAGACLLFIRRGRALFAPWPAPWRRARQV